MNAGFNPSKFFIFGFENLEPSRDFMKFLEMNPPAGFLLLGNNYRGARQMRVLTESLRAIGGPKTVFAVDQEPGRVQRFKAGLPVSKKPSRYLKQGNMGEYRTWCADTARALAEMGVNMNLAPVVDLLPEGGGSTVLEGRAFGDKPERAAEFGTVLFEEFKRAGIVTCAKHFPGLGSAAGDPHEVLTRSNESLERFLDYHWRPFKAMASAGIGCIMTTHLLAPSIDPEECATYSKNAVSHIRNTIGHRGPIITDDLFMAGAVKQGGIGGAAVAALQAGHNLLIVSKTLDIQVRAVEAIRQVAEEDESFARLCAENEKKMELFRNAI
jgi:beta-N-acetylhexosaminidase